jgi:cation transport regulator
MPYATNFDLPAAVRNHLPDHAQDIFRASFNHAYEKHRDDPRHEEIAHRITWSAVKWVYEKSGDMWIARSELH